MEKNYVATSFWLHTVSLFDRSWLGGYIFQTYVKKKVLSFSVSMSFCPLQDVILFLNIFNLAPNSVKIEASLLYWVMNLNGKASTSSVQSMDMSSKLIYDFFLVNLIYWMIQCSYQIAINCRQTNQIIWMNVVSLSSSPLYWREITTQIRSKIFFSWLFHL